MRVRTRQRRDGRRHERDQMLCLSSVCCLLPSRCFALRNRANKRRLAKPSGLPQAVINSACRRRLIKRHRDVTVMCLTPSPAAPSRDSESESVTA